MLVYRETHMTSPLLPVDLLRIPVFALSIATSIASFCGQMLAFVSIPFYLQSRFGYSAVHMGSVDHAMADRGGVRGTAGRPPGRSVIPAGVPHRRHRTHAVRLRSRRARLAAGRPDAVRHHLAHGASAGAGFGLFQTPQQPHHDRGRPARAGRWRQRHAGARRGCSARPPARRWLRYCSAAIRSKERGWRFSSALDLRSAAQR
ncbi:hypothetical protein ACRAWF_06540 [Streptomyces sp. L7]